ncbi:MAG: SMP-30/gluconolactonase/LRE family protein [Candidatus Krumholzibacteriota bacterium]|nr:SMP-30/gluconolactonase/LRE family protein [Candidatus Krumholzibacteriota bacterium]
MIRIVAVLLVLMIFPPLAEAGAFTLVKQWVTERVFKVPESVIYDAERNVIYVSNINGKPTEKNGRGFLSKVSLAGEIVELEWITGLNAPKGSGIVGNLLYVADIDELVEIDIEKGKILGRYAAAGARFLNDIAVDDKGTVYLSDTHQDVNAIYRFQGGKLRVWLRDEMIKRPNGLFVEEDRLIIGCGGEGRLLAVDLEGKKITEIARAGTGVDGIAMDGKGNFLVSNWAGKTMLIEPDGGVRVLLDTTVDKINSADITFIIKKDLLLIPTFYDNRIVACRLAR